MPNCIARIFEPLLRLLLPRTGRHRAADVRSALRGREVRASALARFPVGEPLLLRGEDAALVRPYVLSPEERQERRLQRAQQRQACRTVHVAGAGTLRVHDREVVG